MAGIAADDAAAAAAAAADGHAAAVAAAADAHAGAADTHGLSRHMSNNSASSSTIAPMALLLSVSLGLGHASPSFLFFFLLFCFYFPPSRPKRERASSSAPRSDVPLQRHPLRSPSSFPIRSQEDSLSSPRSIATFVLQFPFSLSLFFQLPFQLHECAALARTRSQFCSSTFRSCSIANTGAIFCSSLGSLLLIISTDTRAGTATASFGACCRNVNDSKGADEVRSVAESGVHVITVRVPRAVADGPIRGIIYVANDTLQQHRQADHGFLHRYECGFTTLPDARLRNFLTHNLDTRWLLTVPVTDSTCWRRTRRRCARALVAAGAEIIPGRIKWFTRTVPPVQVDADADAESEESKEVEGERIRSG